MKIPNLMHCFRNETERPILNTISLIFIGIVTTIVLLCFLNTNSTISYIWAQEHYQLIDDSFTIKRDFQLQIDIGLRILNTSRAFYEITTHQLKQKICDGDQAICSGSTLEIQINQMYKVMKLMYQKLYSKKNALLFYLDSSSNEYAAFTFGQPAIKEIYNRLNMTDIASRFQAELDPQMSYVYFFDRWDYFVKCLKISPTSSIYTCVLIDHQFLTFQSKRVYFIFLNDEVFYTNYMRDITTVNSLINDYVHYLSFHSYIGYSDPQTIVQQCYKSYEQFSQNGLFECLYSRTKIWSFPVLFEQLYVLLPNLYYKKLSFHRQQYIESNVKLIIIPDVDKSYDGSKIEIDKMRVLLCQTMRYSVLIIIGLHLFFMINRLFVQHFIVEMINKIGKKSQNQSKLIAKLSKELKPVAQTIQKYQWVIEYSKSPPEVYEVMLMEGLQIFSKQKYEYLSINRHLYTTLIEIGERQQNYLIVADLYQKFIELEMNHILGQQQKINSQDINRIYKLQLSRIQCYDKFSSMFQQSSQKTAEHQLLDKTFQRSKQKQKQKILGISINQLFERLEQYKQHIDIDQRLIQRGVMLKIKLKYAYGIGNSFRLLEQLQNSECEVNIKNEIRYIYAIQLRKKKPLFDYQAMDKLNKILKTSTTSQFKRKSLKLLMEILNDYPETFSILHSQLSRISNFYNYKNKSLFIRRQTLPDKANDKTFQNLIKDFYTLFDKSLVSDDKNLVQNESWENLYDSLVTSNNNNLSFHSVTYSLMKDMKFIAESSNQNSKFVVIYHNDLFNTEKQKQDKREFQGIMQGIGTFLHIIIVGTNIKADILKKNKLIRGLKQKNNLIYVDLHDYDFSSLKEKMMPFLE